MLRLARAICYGALNRGVAELTSLSDLRLARIAAIGALVAALGLAGCGRKGGLDPPPGATAADTSPSRPDLEPQIRPGKKALPSPQSPPRRTRTHWPLNRALPLHQFCIHNGVLPAFSRII